MKDKIKKITIFAFFATIFIACKKESAPTIDNIKPKLTFEINGLRKFYSDTDYTALGILYLQPGHQYNFTVIAADTAGVKDFSMSLDTFVRINNVFSTPTFTSNSALVHGYQQQIYTIISNETDPYRSFIMGGSILPNASVQNDTTITLFFTGNDYNPNNITHITIPCHITYQPPSGYGWKSH